MPRPIKPKISESQNYVMPALELFNHESLHFSIKSKKKYYSLVQRLINIFLCDETTQMSLFEVVNQTLQFGNTNYSNKLSDKEYPLGFNCIQWLYILPISLLFY